MKKYLNNTSKRSPFKVGLLALLVLASSLYLSVPRGSAIQDPVSTSSSRPVVGSCMLQGRSIDQNNQPEQLAANTQYSGEQELNVIKHRKSSSSKDWRFWMTDVTKNCSEVHYYPDNYETPDPIPLVTGAWPEEGEAIGDGEDYQGPPCCYKDKPNVPLPNSVTPATDVAHGVDVVYAFNQTFFGYKGIDKYLTPMESFVLHSPFTDEVIPGMYLPTSPNKADGKYDKQHPLHHRVSYYLTDGGSVYWNQTYLSFVGRMATHAKLYTHMFGANIEAYEPQILDDEVQIVALTEDIADYFSLAMKNWSSHSEDKAVCEPSCVWTLGEEGSAVGVPVVDYSQPFVYGAVYTYPKGVEADGTLNQKEEPYYKILGYTLYAAAEGLTVCQVDDPANEDYLCEPGSNPFISESFDGIGIDKAFEIFGQLPDLLSATSDYRQAKGLTLYATDRRWPAKDSSSGKYLPQQVSEEYKVIEQAFDGSQVPSDIEPYLYIDQSASSSSIERNDPKLNIYADLTDDQRRSGDLFHVDLFLDGVPVTKSTNGVDGSYDFSFNGTDPTEAKWLEFKDVKALLQDGQKQVEAVVKVTDIYGSRIASAKQVIPVKDTDPNVKPPEITFKGPSGESPDSSTSNPIYKARLEAEASEGRPLNPDGAYFVLDTGVEQINVEVSDDYCTASDQEIVCDTEFKVDSRYNEAEGNVQDPYDGGTAYDEGEHQDHTAGLSYVEHGSSAESAPE